MKASGWERENERDRAVWESGRGTVKDAQNEGQEAATIEVLGLGARSTRCERQEAALRH